MIVYESINKEYDGLIVGINNMIIKGDNLTVMQHLKHKFKNSIKIVYADPPYNTGLDNYSYNNKFDSDNWLLDMEERLKVAYYLLREDGFIILAIDHFELFYLGILCDKLFGRENRVGIISVICNPMGRNQAKFLSTVNDYMLVYSKNKQCSEFNKVILDDKVIKTFDKMDNKGKYKLKDFIRVGGGDANLRKNKPSFWYPLYVSSDLKKVSIYENEGYFEVLPITANNKERTWKLSKRTTEKILDELVPVKIKDRVVIKEKYRIAKGKKVTTVWSDKRYNANHNGMRLLKKIVGDTEFSYPKSLYTIIDILELTTCSNDIVLDIFAGSGTTAHAVIELNREYNSNRKYILIEELDKQVSVCIDRIKAVSNGYGIDYDFDFIELN